VSWAFISEEPLNKQPKKECGPLTNFEYKTDREDLTPISRIFEEVVDIAIQLTNVKDRKKLGNKIMKNFYQNPIYKNLEDIVNDPIQRIGITHHCLKYIQKELKSNK
jgi:hypothetical protein